MTTHPEEDALVSLKEVMETIEKEKDKLIMKWDADKAKSQIIDKLKPLIKALPTTTPQRTQPNGWIPVEERLPETYELVLIRNKRY